MIHISLSITSNLKNEHQCIHSVLLHNIYVEKLKMFPFWKSLSMNWRFLIISQEDNEIDEMLRSQEASLTNIKLVSTANLNK